MELVQTCLQLLVSAIQLEASTSTTDGHVHEARWENTRLQKDMDFLRKVIKNQVRIIALLESRLGKADQRVQRGSMAASSIFAQESGIDALIRLGHSVAETGFLPRQRSPSSPSSSESSLETMTSISEAEARPPVIRTIRDGPQGSRFSQYNDSSYDWIRHVR
ncbi:hypothetical protein CGGC5_v017143 [Colletotrichum fructicola Nara gc5]|uniref:Uncharacterized protein n=1 Tax=Colletotrichum fructicola (strain Nara gc5) TaxID=1213859 RepID=A0A7J6ICR0_COLFN|nr:hypothetical protein CGGC5_v017143 [Colletotrichum fructicola Nara gc5]